MIRPLTLLLALAAVTLPVLAQPAATAPAARAVLVMPPGFEKVTVGDHTALCQPNDAQWVKGALASIKPATRPTTMPSDLLTRIAQKRPEVVKQMVTDLALPDDKIPNALFDDHLLPLLKKMEQLRPPVFFLVCTREKLRDLVKNGWGEPRYHYNRIANEVSYDDNIPLSLEHPMGDAVLPSIYTDNQAPAERADKLSKGIAQLDAALLQRIAQQGQPMVFGMVAEQIGLNVFEPMKLRRDQQWIGLGITGYLASKYAGELTPTPRDQWLKEMTFENPRYPVSSKGIDLAHPLEVTAMRPAAVPYYNQALRRKAVTAVATLAQKGGDAALTKVVAALRTKLPADGPALVKMIHDTTAVDLAKEVAAE
jgi:hypothetical protein